MAANASGSVRLNHLWTLSLQTGSIKERLVQLQRCMHALQEPGAPRSHAGQEGSSLGAILALMAAVLTECDLHCHSQALGMMAKRLGGLYLFIFTPLRHTHTHTHRKRLCSHSPTYSKQNLNGLCYMLVIDERIGIHLH